LSKYWKNGKNPLEEDVDLLTSLMEALGKGDLTQVVMLLKPHLKVEKFYAEGGRVIEAVGVTEDSVKGLMEILPHPAVDHDQGMTALVTPFTRNFAYFLRHLRNLYTKILPPNRVYAQEQAKLNTVPRLFVYANFIEPMDVNDTSECLLRVVNTSTQAGLEGMDSTYEVFSSLLYHPVVKLGKISMIHAYITGEDGQLVPFQSGRVLLTFHFRRRR
jgi:hypothetical protein